MTTVRSILGRLVIGLASVLLILTLAPTAKAQYSVPDCMIAGLNGLMNNQDYYAGRDESYKKLSADWSSYVAGLTPEQLTGYSAYACAHLTVVDLGKDSEEAWHWRLDYPSTEEYFAAVGGHPGSTNSGNTGSGNDSGSIAPVKTGGVKNADAAPFSPAENIVFQTDFADVPEHFQMRDENGRVIDPELAIDGKTSALHVSTTGNRSFLLTNAADWTDYAVEARVRATNGIILLSGRMADDNCSGYNAFINVSKDTAALSRSYNNCGTRSIDNDDDLGLKPNQWVTLRLEIVGDQLSLFIDGKFTIIGNDKTYDQGFPALYFQPERGKTGVLDIDSFKVTELHAPPATLTDYDAAPGVAVAELQKLGQVPAGKGQLIFVEDHAYFTGTGNFFQPLGETAPHADIVMAGDMTFKSAGSSDDYEDCSLMARIIDGDPTTQELLVAFDNDGYLDVYDYDDPSSEDSATYYTHDTPFTPGETYHLLFTVVGSQLAAYVDGKLTLVVNDLPSRKGYYGISLSGTSANSRCDGRNVWVYSFS